MRIAQTALLCLTAISLAACIPFVGHNTGSDKSYCIGMVFLPLAPVEQDIIGNCYLDMPERTKPAMDSTKHVQLSEQQRLHLAKEAAKKFYPWEENKFRVAQYISSVAVGSMYPEGNATVLNCNEMITVRDFAVYLQNRLPQDYFYNAIAEIWSYIYSDEQILMISNAAKNGPLTNIMSLSPQPDIYPNMASAVIYSSANKYADSNKAAFRPKIKHIHDVIVSQHRTLTVNAGCSIEGIGSSTGYYEFKENIHYPDRKMEQNSLPVMSPVQ